MTETIVVETFALCPQALDSGKHWAKKYATGEYSWEDLYHDGIVYVLTKQHLPVAHTIGGQIQFLRYGMIDRLRVLGHGRTGKPRYGIQKLSLTDCVVIDHPEWVTRCEARLDVERWMGKIPARVQRIVVGILSGESFQEISQAIGISCGRVSQLLRRHLPQWRAAIEIARRHGNSKTGHWIRTEAHRQASAKRLRAKRNEKIGVWQHRSYLLAGAMQGQSKTLISNRSRS